MSVRVPNGSDAMWHGDLGRRHHRQALLCLARRRANVLFAMLGNGTFHESRLGARWGVQSLHTRHDVKKEKPFPGGSDSA
ncbi:hypothetical protein ACFY4B_17780 [Kitasatospora sp. NPDC001261]|uniref:hypothetical protein n=1 Tax=Kitasatospora sp. NPDC001261 TaxID=3364012 RepID=UPI00367A5F88